MAPMPALSLRPQLLPLWLLATLCSGSLLTQSLAYAAPIVEERVAAVTNMVTAFRAGDIPTFLTYYTEDAVYKYEGTPSIPWAGSFHVSLLIHQAERRILKTGVLIPHWLKV